MTCKLNLHACMHATAVCIPYCLLAYTGFIFISLFPALLLSVRLLSSEHASRLWFLSKEKKQPRWRRDRKNIRFLLPFHYYLKTHWLFWLLHWKFLGTFFSFCGACWEYACFMQQQRGKWKKPQCFCNKKLYKIIMMGQPGAY